MYDDLFSAGFLHLADHAATPFAEKIADLFRRNHAELVQLSVVPADYSDVVTFSKDYCLLNLVKKFAGLRTGIDKKEAALLTFRKCEEKCKETNDRLRAMRTSYGLNSPHNALLQRIRGTISKVWGNPTFSDLFDRCAWGPGATASLKGANATVDAKMSQFPLSVTPTAVPYLRAVLRTDFVWVEHLLGVKAEGPVTLLDCCFDLVSDSRLLTVSKDAKTDRTICAEPTGNIFLQKSIAAWLRKRLKHFGINLDDQTRNQLLAKAAIILGVSTIDLKNASDSVCIEALKLLCPAAMFDLLEALRTPSYEYENVSTRFHKFSSMGNGFTFELESLLFYSILVAVCGEGASSKIGTYGDDLVCPSEHYDSVVAALELFGFSVNTEKSFRDGRFFESCGKHYFDGFDVTPPYQKSTLDNSLELIRFLNRLKTAEERWANTELDIDKWLERTHSYLLRKVPSWLKKYQGYSWMQGDGFFFLSAPTLKYCHRRGYQLKYLVEKPKAKCETGLGFYAYQLRKQSWKARETSFELRPDPVLPTYGKEVLRTIGKPKALAITSRTRWVSGQFRYWTAANPNTVGLV
jgi:hypothetical protein